MSRKFVCLLLILLMAALPLSNLAGAQVTSVMAISMNGVTKATIVAGVIHNISLDISQASDDVVLRAYLASGFTTSNSTNNYSWSYSSGTWSDDLYGYYIRNESARFGNKYCFFLSIDSIATPGNWRFVTYVDGAEVSNRQIMVERPWAGISMSAPTFYFNVIPYGTGFVSSWNPDNASTSEYLTTTNTGNVPLTLKITFDTQNPFGTSSSFSSTNGTGTYLPSEKRTHYLSFQAQQWSPRKFTVKGYVSGEPQIVMTPNTVSTVIAPRTTFDVVVTVARPGYDVYQMDGVTVQYKSFYYSAFKRTISMDMYLTGNKSVYMDHDMQNLSFNHFLNQDQESTEEMFLTLTDSVEQHVVANITCSTSPPWKQPSMIAYANFNLRLSDNSATGRFTSNVVISATSEAETDTPISASILVVIILAVVFLIIAAFLFKVYRKTEEERRRELEDKIRKRKERVKKQRRN